MNQLNNPLWPFPIHNGERTEVSKKLLKKDQKESAQGLSDVVNAVTQTYKIEDWINMDAQTR